MTVVVDRVTAARELLERRRARCSLAAYIRYTTPRFKENDFSLRVCQAIEKFIIDVQAGLRPVLVLQAPPQHGKSEIVSRKLPAYLLGLFPDWRIGAASYASDLAGAMSLDVRRNLAAHAHRTLFPTNDGRRRYAVDRNGEFTAPGGEGGYVGVGVGGGLTGRPLDVGIIDDPTKNAEEALSETTKKGHWNWYQTVFLTRLSEQSGQIIMATSWAEDDLPGRVIESLAGSPRLTVLRFPAINEMDEPGFNPDLPRGALVPELHSLEQLLEIKAGFSDYWWAAMYQQSPRSLGGNVFKEEGIQYYLPKDLPEKFDKVIASWDCTFKDTDGTDFVVGQAWGKKGAISYLLGQIRARMSFTKTQDAVLQLKESHPRITATLVEDKANGPAIIDTLKSIMPGLIAIEPDGSKLARAHAITAYWEAQNIFLPHPDIAPWVKALVSELLSFPAAPHDDQVDSLTQALRHLYPAFGILRISKTLLERAAGKRSHT